jgi:hypothetical protein
VEISLGIVARRSSISTINEAVVRLLVASLCSSTFSIRMHAAFCSLESHPSLKETLKVGLPVPQRTEHRLQTSVNADRIRRHARLILNRLHTLL